MRIMRLFGLLLFIALAGALAGCGGGSGGSGNVALRTVTVTLRWPSADKATSRVLPAAVNTVSVEVYDGIKRVEAKTIPLNQKTVDLSLPAKQLTFYVNGYTDGSDHGYVTDPATGQPAKSSGGAFTPLAASDPHPAVHASSLVDVPNQRNIVFTLENTIAALVPIAGRTTFGLDQAGQPANQPLLGQFAAISLRDTVQAVTADGAIVLTGPSSLTFATDPNNAVENKRVQVDATDATNPRLLLKATGVAHVTVTDNEVNSDAANHQSPITAVIAYTLTPRSSAQTLTLYTSSNPQLLATVPFYAKSVTFTLSQDPLVAPDANAALNDNPPPPVNSQSYPVSVTRSDSQGVTAISLPNITTDFVPTGRTLTLAVKAWSNSDGTGALLAQNSQSGLAPVAASPSVTLSSNVQGFVISPANPTVNLTNTSPAPAGQNTLQVQIAAQVSGNSTPIPIDPGALAATITKPDGTVNSNVAITYPTTPVDSNGNPYLKLSFNYGNAIPATASTSLTVRDRTPNNKSASTTINLTGYTPIFSLQ